MHSILQHSETKFQLSCSYCWQILPLKKLQLHLITHNWKCKQHKHVGFVIPPHASFLADIGTFHLHPEDNIPPVILARWKGKPLTQMAALSPLTHGKHLPSFSPFWDQNWGFLKSSLVEHQTKKKPKQVTEEYADGEMIRAHTDNYLNYKIKLLFSSHFTNVWEKIIPLFWDLN